MRRYSLRLDGFVSVSAPAGPGGELITKPLTFNGSTLHLNFATSAAGSIRVELQNPNGSAIDGFALADCDELFGDTVDRTVVCKNGIEVSRFEGKPVRLRFQLQDANLFAIQFAT